MTFHSKVLARTRKGWQTERRTRRTDGRTDRRTDEQTDGHPNYNCFQNKIFLILNTCLTSVSRISHLSALFCMNAALLFFNTCFISFKSIFNNYLNTCLASVSRISICACAWKAIDKVRAYCVILTRIWATFVDF